MPLYTTREAAEACHVDPETIKLWIRQGHLPASGGAGYGYRIRGHHLHSFARRHGIDMALLPEPEPFWRRQARRLLSGVTISADDVEPEEDSR